jgi:hypothetical protein
VLIQSVSGSINSTTDWPATTVVPGSALRTATMPSTSATSSRLLRCEVSAWPSARARAICWVAAPRPASATCSSWRLPATISWLT